MEFEYSWYENKDLDSQMLLSFQVQNNQSLISEDYFLSIQGFKVEKRFSRSEKDLTYILKANSELSLWKEKIPLKNMFSVFFDEGRFVFAKFNTDIKTLHETYSLESAREFLDSYFIDHPLIDFINKSNLSKEYRDLVKQIIE